MNLRTLIADDEQLARERLRYLLANETDVRIDAECRTGKEVIERLKESTFDVLFLDIQMPGRGGFDVIEQVGVENMPITVFVTAHNQYAIQAFEVSALDYLTKPVEFERLRAALVKVRERMAARAALHSRDKWMSAVENLEHLLTSKTNYPSRLLVPNGSSKDSVIQVEDIDWIEAADYYACLHVGSRSHMLRETIKELATTLDPKTFVRIHRSVIVNVGRVSEILREGRSEGAVILLDGRRLRMSKMGWQNMLAVHHR
ncbi:MAG: LytTR family DNA-binding domain-containing protein [Edaphobacter sp.]|uniref:LytR/AlgR family response regulator transcription factor n=1 Tax=Edaphobacter sp. TaxID=1934404 RepID=UPI00238DC702|nr:LytTR family DNA-binding domain-containing protein [Edaphobacter sp.]MDE1175690.1 LytTR family DNA-binding domain-containing protein [Edaphobacter sp.]